MVHLVASIDPENSQSIAETLLAEVYSLDRIWSRSPEALARILGQQSPVIGLLLAAREAGLEAIRAGLLGRVIEPSRPKLIEYLKTSMGSIPEEILHVLFLAASRRPLPDEQ